jgi:hypothetical protein
MPNGRMVDFRPVDKKKELVTSIHTHRFNDMHQHVSPIHALLHTYLLSSLALVAPHRISPSLLSSQSRLSLFTHQMGLNALQLPIISLAWLAQISLLIVIPTQTLINHKDTYHG